MIIQADILKWAKEYDGEPMMAVLCDPPYGLNENEIDIQAILADWLADREHQPKGAGFMGREWDSFIPGPRIWRAIRERCYPGALLMAFGGTRTADLLGLALRLGGWEKIDEIDWIYGSGFPKNHSISKAIDRAAKAERPIVGTRKHQPKFDAAGFAYRKKDNGYNSKGRESFNVTTAATDLARTWEGYGTALKPAHEPILVFRNPFKGTYAANCTRTGVGALNIDGARVSMAAGDQKGEFGPHKPEHLGKETTLGVYGGSFSRAEADQSSGRWPSNLLLQHSPSCRPAGTQRVRGTRQGTQRGNANFRGGERHDLERDAGYADADGYETVTAWACAEDCPVAALDRQSGVSGEKARVLQRNGKRQMEGWGLSAESQGVVYGDSGGASRFFHQSDWAYEIEERIAAADPVRYCAKASKAEREGGLDPMQIKLLGMMEVFDETTVDDGRETPIDNPYLRGETKRRNTHPTIKPISLTRYLATLLLPPADYAPRRILIPFAGAGSEAIGATLAGWEEVIGVELESQHVAIATARMAFWRALRYRLLDPEADLSIDLDQSAPDQRSLWDVEAA